MRFEQTYPLFLGMDEAGRREFFANYRQRRNEDIDRYVAKAKREKKAAQPAEKLVLSPEQREMMKKLGLTVKDIQALKSLTGGGTEWNSRR